MKKLFAILSTTLVLSSCGGGGGSAGVCTQCPAEGGDITPPASTTSSNTTTSTSSGNTSPVTVSQYAGQWSAVFSGGDQGSCPEITIDNNGNITGTCSTAAIPSFSIAGTVTANGTLEFTSATTSAVFSSTNSTPTYASGTWSISTDGATGIWNATHQ